MPICEICKKKKKTTFKCKECGAKHCDKCGDVDRELCLDCLRYEESMRYELDQDVFELDTD